GVLSNLARYSFRGPNFFGLDAGVFRRFTITERTGLEVRAQAFGVTNTPQFDNPNADSTNPNFGKITGAQGSRTVELGAKFTFYRPLGIPARREMRRPSAPGYRMASVFPHT